MFDKPATAGKIEYEAACMVTSSYVVSRPGHPARRVESPAWDDLSSSAREAWEAAAQAELDSTVPERTP
jgi:hypothetical protein